MPGKIGFCSKFGVLLFLSCLLSIELSATSFPIKPFFIPNAGQLDQNILFSARFSDQSVYFKNRSVVFQKKINRDSVTRIENIEMVFNGVSGNLSPLPFGQLPSQSNYLVGNKENWKTAVPNYSGVGYTQIYNGIDLKCYSSPDGKFEYDYIVKAGFSLSQIQISYGGIESLTIDKDRNLHLTTKNSDFIEKIPEAYQVINGKKVKVTIRYKLIDGTIGFVAEKYNSSYDLIIDPIIFYSTYVGGNGDEFLYFGNVEKDNAGNLYVAGRTNSTNFPTTAGAYDLTSNGNFDAFVFKLNAAGTGLVYSTYIGGSDLDVANDLYIDLASNQVIITGAAWSTNFPTSGGAYQTTNSGVDGDIFILKLNA
ncbi:MAG: hypothetical protein IAF38_18810, partial [Bacteroidia bacterium]|nr:hypothetical protein [Bacteroidia bacterium]